LAASEQVKSDHETSFAAIIGCRISEGGGPQVLSGLVFYINKSSRESRRLEVLFELPHRPGQHRVQAIIAARARAVGPRPPDCGLCAFGDWANSPQAMTAPQMIATEV
jgi:hypothetical protein